MLDVYKRQISCNEGCIARSYALKNATCAVNPICGHEIDGGIPKAETPLRVLVVGAGPGGCTAALYSCLLYTSRCV